MLERMAALLDRSNAWPLLRWLRDSLGQDVRSMVRTHLKKFLEQLDAGQLVRVHRSVVVNPM